MKLKPYPKYKNSGIQWIGEIPEGWEVRKIKHLCFKGAEYGLNEPSDNYVDDGVRFLRITDITENGNLIENGVYLPENKTNKEYLLNTGDVLVARSGSIGTSLYFDKEKYERCLFAGYLVRFVVNKSNNGRFLYYFTNSKSFYAQIELETIQTTIGNFNGQKYANMRIAIPPLPDQTTIANFLDKKTAKNDALIEKDKQLIALLKEKRTALINHAVTKGLDPNVKLKDFGIEWIGEIPGDAKIMPFRRVCYVNQGLQFPEDERLSEPDEKSKIYITIKYIHADEDGVKEYIPNPPRSVICKKEDVLLARTGATGEVITNQEGVFHNNFFKVNYNSKIDRDYLVYYLKMDSIKKVLLLKAGVTTIPDLNHDAFLSTPFILYSIEKQKQIAGYLDKKTAKIDKTIKLIEKKIKLLEEYKKSLIHYLVTGKVDVSKSEV